MGVISNMPSGFIPDRAINPLTATFVDVPMSVQVPPRIEAKAIGRRSLDALTLAFLARPMTGPTSMAVTVVLFMKAEVPPTPPISSKSRRFSPPLASFTSRAPMASTTPVSCSAPLSTKIDARMMMISSLNPWNASETESTPEPTSASSRISVMMSTEMISMANSTTATTSSPSTKGIFQLSGRARASTAVIRSSLS